MDWFSRYVLAWQLSNTLDVAFFLDVLEKALAISKAGNIQLKIRGCSLQELSLPTGFKSVGIMISMDGRGRVFDNIFVKRLWRSVKYEEVYVESYESVSDARNGLHRYFQFYNKERLK